MNNLKSTVSGIDVSIQGLQVYLYDKLKSLWSLDESTIQGYGRCYRNTNDKGVIPEVFVSGTPGTNNTVYKAAYGQNGFDQTTTYAQFFFDVDPVTKFKQGAETTVLSLIVIVNLEKVKPLLSHRGDEEVRCDIEKLLMPRFYGIDMTGSEVGYKNVFRSFTGVINQDGEVYEDRHPLYCLKFNADIVYNPTLVQCK